MEFYALILMEEKMRNNLKKIIVLLWLALTIQANATEPLVRQVEVTKADSVFLHHLIYNANNKQTVDTKYWVNNDERIRQNQTEWVYSNGKCTEQRERKWIDDAWQETHLISSNYNGQKKTEEIFFDLTNGTEKPISKVKWIYSNNKLLLKITSQFNGNVWQQQQKISYSYNTKNKVQTATYFIYENGVLADKQKVEYQYLENDSLSNFVVSNYENDEWINAEKTVLYYDTIINKVNLEVYKKWDKTYNVWKNRKNIQYKYDTKKNKIASIQQYWAGLFWKNDIQYKFYYNEDNLLVNKETYLPIHNAYRLTSVVEYTEFEHDKPSLIQSKYKFWGGTSNELTDVFIPYLLNNEMKVENASKIKLLYTPFDDNEVSTDNDNLSKNKIKVYPNPSRGIFYFDTENLVYSNWIISDMKGRVILKSNTPNKSGIIDLGSFEKGIYLLQIFTTKGVKTQKLIKN